MSQNTPSLRALEHNGAFVERHIGPDASEIAQMLAVVGQESLESLTDAIVPGSIKAAAALDLPGSLTEVQALEKIRAIAGKNKVLRSFIGQGYYGTHTPNVVARNILENPAWYTAYTPYQAEISQGRMEALINFQTMVAELCGMEIANASLLDEATAAAEAMTLAKRSARASPTCSSCTTPCTRRPWSCSRPAPSRWTSSSSSAPRRRRWKPTASACCCSTRTPSARSPTTPRWSRPSTPARAWSPWPPTCWR
jgi:Glycine cleavage system protein P (pyridoxal-binding), N-terminal domain